MFILLSKHCADICTFGMVCKACVRCVFTLLMALARPPTPGVVKDNSGSDKKQTEEKIIGTKDRETSGQFF